MKSALEAVDCKGNVNTGTPVPLKHSSIEPRTKDSVSRYLRSIVSLALDKCYYYEFPHRHYAAIRKRFFRV
jgi:hypothetical protein